MIKPSGNEKKEKKKKNYQIIYFIARYVNIYFRVDFNLTIYLSLQPHFSCVMQIKTSVQD